MAHSKPPREALGLRPVAGPRPSKTDIVVAVLGIVPVTVGGPRVLGFIVE
jgi:hypothetical protein